MRRSSSTRTLLNLGLTLVLGAIGIGCTPGGPLYVDARFTAAERSDIQAAADMWESVGAPLYLVWDAHTTGRDPSRRELLKCNHRGASNLDPEFQTVGVVGRGSAGRIILDMDRIQELGDSLRLVAAHEMGHMLMGSAAHAEGGPALMNAVRGDVHPEGLTELDVALLCQESGMGCGGSPGEAFGSP